MASPQAKKARHLFPRLLVACCVASIFAAGGVWYWWNYLPDEGMTRKEVEQIVKDSIKLGSTRQDVKDWFEAQSFRKTYREVSAEDEPLRDEPLKEFKAAGKSYGGKSSVTIYGRLYKRIMCGDVTYIVLYFDTQGTLVTYSMSSMNIGM